MRDFRVTTVVVFALTGLVCCVLAVGAMDRMSRTTLNCRATIRTGAVILNIRTRQLHVAVQTVAVLVV